MFPPFDAGPPPAPCYELAHVRSDEPPVWVAGDACSEEVGARCVALDAGSGEICKKNIDCSIEDTCEMVIDAGELGCCIPCGGDVGCPSDAGA